MSAIIPVEPEAIGWVDDDGVFHGFYIKDGFDAYVLTGIERESLESIIDRHDSIGEWIEDEAESGGYENGKDLLNQSPSEYPDTYITLTGETPLWTGSGSGLAVMGVWIVERIHDDVLDEIEVEPHFEEDILLSTYGKGARVGGYYFGYARRTPADPQ